MTADGLDDDDDGADGAGEAMGLATRHQEDPLVETILQVASGPKSVTAEEIARTFGEPRLKPKDPADAWRRYLTPVKQVALRLARDGRLEIVRKGAVVDPNDFKGVVRYRTPR